MKKLISLCLVLALALGTGAPALAVETDAAAKFPAVNAYPGYADVPDGAWYAQAAQICYETGLLTGTDAGFSHDREMTVAEAAVIASRIHSILNGGTGVISSPEGEAWYAGAVSYLQQVANAAENNDVPYVLNSPAEPIWRSQFFSLLALVVPQELLTPINHITALPDTSDETVLQFYNAGILTGTNGYGTFCGGKSLTRAECAAMVARLVYPELRTSFTPRTPDLADFDPADYLVGMPGSTPYLTGGGATITLGEFLACLVPEIDSLVGRCEDEGVEFDWTSYTIGGENFVSYTTMYANSAAFCCAWLRSQVPEDTIPPDQKSAAEQEASLYTDKDFARQCTTRALLLDHSLLEVREQILLERYMEANDCEDWEASQIIDQEYDAFVDVVSNDLAEDESLGPAYSVLQVPTFFDALTNLRAQLETSDSSL